MSAPLESHQRAALRLVVLLLFVVAAVTLAPLWTSLVLAAWFAAFARPLLARLARGLGNRDRAAAVLTILLLLGLVLPLGLIVAALTGDALDLMRRILSSQGGRSALEAIVSGSSTQPGVLLHEFKKEKLVELVREYGANAWNIAEMVAGATAKALLDSFLFLIGAYTFLVDGPRAFAWAECHAPLAPRHLRRLAAAFHETGRGLVIGIGLTGLAQGLCAMIIYLALGIPRALVLGLLTCFAALIPSVGTGLVWVPVAAGLALTGRTLSALVLLVLGVLVIGTIDNVLRPVFSRYGQLNLPTFLLLIAIFGGLAAFGPWGIVLGPLFVRFAKEALAIAREEQLWQGWARHRPIESEKECPLPLSEQRPEPSLSYPEPSLSYDEAMSDFDTKPEPHDAFRNDDSKGSLLGERRQGRGVQGERKSQPAIA